MAKCRCKKLDEKGIWCSMCDVCDDDGYIYRNAIDMIEYDQVVGLDKSGVINLK